MAERTGNVIFENFIISDSKVTGFSSLKTNYTIQNTVLKNSVIIGRTESVNVSDVWGATAMYTPITERGLLIDTVTFVNFELGMTIISNCNQQCNPSWNFNKGGNFVIFKKISFINCDEIRVIKWNYQRRDYIIDLDGSLSGTNNESYITPYYPHF